MCQTLFYCLTVNSSRARTRPLSLTCYTKHLIHSTNTYQAPALGRTLSWALGGENYKEFPLCDVQELTAVYVTEMHTQGYDQDRV